MSTKNLIIAIAALIIVVGGAYYASQMYYPVPANNTVTDIAETGNAVGITNFSFSPASLSVKAGTAVTWTNNDSAAHTIKSVTFNSGSLAKGQKFEFTFQNKGEFDYSCGIHPSMTGKIIVE